MAYHPQSICGFLLTDIMFTWQLVLLNNVNVLLMLRHRKIIVYSLELMLVDYQWRQYQ